MAEPIESLPRIPRDQSDDYSPGAVQGRRVLCERAAGRELPHVAGRAVSTSLARGNVENLIGFAQVPLGIAGPLRVDTSDGPCEVYVPMATTEGAMVASYSRGMRLLAAAAEAGRSASARVVHEGLTQNPILVYARAEQAIEASKLAMRCFDELVRLTGSITRHGKLVALRPNVIGRRLVVSLVFETGDAIGINMAAQATELCSRHLAERSGALQCFVHGQDVEKRANARSTIEGRGRSVVCDVTVPAAALERLTRTRPGELAEIARSYAVGFAQLSTSNWLVQAANGLAAVMIACGQDVAYVTESATGQLDLDVDSSGDLYASVTLPSLLVGTVGGGTAQGTAAECLDLMGCRGPGKARRFAEILGATVLAGDLSLMASFCAGEFVAAHEKLGRNRPREEGA